MPEISNFVSFKIRNGRCVRFWKDRWIVGGVLKDMFPVIYKACIRKEATIAYSIKEGNWHAVFRHNLNDNEQMEWDLLRRDLGNTPILIEGVDEVEFPANFNNKICYDLLTSNVPDCSFSKFIWKSFIPPKVSFLLWAIFNNSLPTRSMLHHRGVQIPNLYCPFCNETLETSDHLLIHCSFTFKLWDYFIKSMRVSWPLPGGIEQLFEAWTMNVMHGRCKHIWKILHYAIVWNVWKERNSRVFGGRPKDCYEIITLIKQTMVLWSCDTETFKFIDSSQIIHNWELSIHIEMPMLQTLKNELAQLMAKNCEDGTFGKMQDEMVTKLCAEEPEFMVDVLQIYSYDVTERLTKIDDLYMNPQMNIRALKNLVGHIEESSLSVGCEKVTLACTEFVKAIEQPSSVNGCERALTHIKREFDHIKAELKEIIQLNRDIRILSTPPQN